MTHKTLMFITDALAANPSQGIEMMDRSEAVPPEVKEAIREAFENDYVEVAARVLEAARRLMEASDKNVKDAGRILKWSAGNFRAA